MKKISLLLLGISLTFFLSAQNLMKVRGKVVNENGKDLPFASIQISPIKKGLQTDSTGKFTFQVPEDGKVYSITISYVGYETKNIIVKEPDLGTIRLQHQQQDAEEVVVIGYQTVKRKDVLASVSSISAKDLKDIPITSAAEALEGKLAGVQITTSEGSPGADIKITVRGGGSITQSNAPLYVVDGVQMENALNLLSPQDIQSIDVLKDAAATAIYGARGANGVVIITTKQGKPGRISLSYNTFFGTKRLTKELPVMSPYDMVMYQYELTRDNSTDSTSFAGKYGTTFDTLINYKKAKPVDWQKLVIGQNGFTQSHNINVGGGNKKTVFNLSYTYNDEKEVVQNSAYQRNLLSLRIEHKLTSRIKLGVSARMMTQNIFGQGLSNLTGTSYNNLRNVLKFQPWLNPGVTSPGQIDPTLNDFTVGNGLDLVNPIALNNAQYAKRPTTDYNVSGFVSYQITKNLSFKSSVGYDNNNAKSYIFNDSITPYSVINGAALPTTEIDTATSKSFNNSNVFTYSLHGFHGVHDLDVIVGEETYEVDSTLSTSKFKNFPKYTSPQKAFDSMSLGIPFTGFPVLLKSKYTSLSYFGRIMYSYKGRYLVTFNFRGDGSSKFSPSNRWGYFPSASVAWRISREHFMKNLTFINDMKIRGGIGSVGNNRIKDYLYINTFNNNVAYYLANGQVSMAYTSAGLVNPNLKWESTIDKSLGIDVTMFRNRINLSLDLYDKTTSGLLLNTPIASTYGYAFQQQNEGSTNNKGIELQISATVIQNKKFRWSSSFNISTNKNVIKSLAPGQSQFLTQGWSGVSGQPMDYIARVGQPVGSMWGLVTDGFYKTSDFDYNTSNGVYTLKTGVVSDAGIIGVVKPGSIKFKDLNGDGIIDVTNDSKIIGNPNPKFFGGWSNQFNYKNWDFSVFINFSYGNQVYNANKIEFTNGYTPQSNLLNIMVNRYRTVDPSTGQTLLNVNSSNQAYGVAPAQLDQLNAKASLWTPLSSSGAFYLHSWAVEDGSFIRLNNATIGYTIRSGQLEKIHVSRLRFYVTGNNLAIITKYSGYDPEVNVMGSKSPLTPGLDYSAYPKSRTILFGLNVTFL